MICRIDRSLRAGRAPASLAVLTVALAVLAGCRQESPTQADVVRPVKILEVGAQMGVRREYPGQIRAAQYSEMAFEVPGRISEFPVGEGQRVQKGQVLARLDPRDYRNKLAAAEAKLQHAAAERDRARILYEKGVKPKSEYELRQRLYEVNNAEAQVTRKALEDTALKAPFDGVVARKLVSDFRNVQAKETVLIVQDDSSFEIKVSVPERDVTIPPGKRPSLEEMTQRTHPRVVLSSLSDQEFPARFTELAKVADPATRTFEATFAFARPEQARVLGGMTAKLVLDILLQSSGETTVPAAAVVSDSGPEPYVWVVDPASMKVSKRTVALGALTGAEVRVETGLQPSDLVVVSGVHQLREGAVVRRLER